MRQSDNKSLFSFWVSQFLTEEIITNRRMSVNTQKSYRDTFLLFIKFLEKYGFTNILRFHIQQITPDLIIAFLQFLENERNASAATCNQRLATIKSFVSYVSRQAPEFLNASSAIINIPKKKAMQKIIDYLSRDEMNFLLELPDKNSYLGYRNFTLLLFMYNTGARASEVAQVKLSDLQLDGSPYVRLMGKGNKHRVCPLWKKTMTAVQNLTEMNAAEHSSHVFYGIRNNPISRHGIYEIIQSVSKSAKLQYPSIRDKNITPHSIRHTTAVHLLMAGVDINSIRAWLGHVSIETTNVYATISLEMKAKAIEKCAITTTESTPLWENNENLINYLKSI